MTDSHTIVVGSRELVSPLRERPEIAHAPIKVFSTDDIRVALETILETRPRFLVLDHEFSKSQRGTAMLERLHADPGFVSTEILVVKGTTVAPLAPTPEPPPEANLDWRGTRRVPRIRMRTGIEVQVDGNVAKLVDLSTLGAQVVSTSALKPNQRVRFVLSVAAGARLSATIAWANFELPQGKAAPQYRAGLEFVDADKNTIERFCVTHAKKERD
jgi:hypothetical protein